MNMQFVKVTLSALLLTSTAYAIAETQDIPATLAISGKVNDTSEYCQITLSDSVVNLNASPDQMVEQGQNASSPTIISFSVKGTKDFTQCSKDVYEGKIAVRFTGTYDNADGTTFANINMGDSAASGVGIGLFQPNKTPIDAREIYQIQNRTNDSTNLIGLELVKLSNQTVKAGTVAGNITFQVERL
ncbi:fimbrial protein [Cronobacter sakazakii]